MKHRSTTNSRKHEDAELYEQYRIDNPECELCEIINGYKSHAHQRHHIFGGTLRYDFLTNLISVCLYCHGWVHSNVCEGRVAALWVKEHKGEINLDELRVACGMRMQGLLSLPKYEMNCAGTKYDEMRLDLLEHWDCEGI